MTEQRIDEIERLVFYRHINEITYCLESCEDHNVVFNIGFVLGKMQKDFQYEMMKEVGDE